MVLLAALALLTGCTDISVSSWNLLYLGLLVTLWLVVFAIFARREGRRGRPASRKQRRHRVSETLADFTLPKEGQLGVISTILHGYYQTIAPRSLLLFVLDRPRGCYLLECYLSTAKVKDDQAFRTTQGILGVVGKLGRGYYLDHVDEDYRGAAWYDDNVPLGSILGLPIGEAPPAAVLVLDSEEEGYFDELRRSLASNCAAVVGRIIEAGHRLSVEQVTSAAYRTFYQLHDLLQDHLDTGEIVQRTLDFLQGLVECQLVALVRNDPPSAGFELVAIRPEGREASASVRRFAHASTSIVSCALKANSILSYDDLEGYHKDLVLFDRNQDPEILSELRSLYLVPVTVRHEIYGALVLGSRNRAAIDAELARRIEKLCVIMGVYLRLGDLYSELRETSVTDGLTGLRNHRYFQDRLGQELTRAGRYGNKLALLLLDIDHFKQVNDTHGHPAGDAVLAALARVLEANIREVDFVARYGGEEFAVVLIEANREDAELVATRLLREVRSLEIALPTGQLSVTISLGVALYPDHAAGKQALVDRADEALYQAKHSGRDRFVLTLGPHDRQPSSPEPLQDHP